MLFMLCNYLRAHTIKNSSNISGYSHYFKSTLQAIKSYIYINQNLNHKQPRTLFILIEIQSNKELCSQHNQNPNYGQPRAMF